MLQVQNHHTILIYMAANRDNVLFIFWRENELKRQEKMLTSEPSWDIVKSQVIPSVPGTIDWNLSSS